MIFKYIYKPDQSGTLLQYFKLALVQPDDVPLPEGKSPIDVISDFLRVFHEHICEQLQKTTLLHDYRQNQYQYVGLFLPLYIMDVTDFNYLKVSDCTSYLVR